MVFKLIRVDVEEPSKIQLLVGKHVIGRGKFLHNDDTDKKVSRNHAELEVTDDSVTLKSIHQNPCFYTKNNTVDIEILQQNSTIALSHGDKFGLIPDNFWYQVIHCTDQDVPTNTTANTNVDSKEENTEKRKDEEEKQNGEQNDVTSCPGDEDDEAINFDMSKANTNVDSKEAKTEERKNEVEKQNGEQNDIMSCPGDKDDDAINFDMSEEVANSNRSASPSLLTTEDREATEEYTVNNQDAGESTEEYTTNNQPAEPLSTPNKRSHDSCDSSPVDVKKVKIEPATPDGAVDQPGPSNDQGASDSDNKDQKPVIAAPPASPPAPLRPLRERCMYGANCYRRNPQHKAQFSHPADSDWGAGARGVCPYGRACCKLDPRHWQHHEHPPGVNPPDPNARRPGQGRNQNKARRKRRDASDSENDSDDSLSNDLIVTGKRSRKTVKRDGWLDTQSDEEDPYKTDESDEWEPPSDFTNSEDFSQKS